MGFLQLCGTNGESAGRILPAVSDAAALSFHRLSADWRHSIWGVAGIVSLPSFRLFPHLLS